MPGNLTQAQIAEGLAELERVRAEQAAERAQEPPAPQPPAGLLPIDFIGSAKQPLSEAAVQALVEG
jgi:hypothetical protein